MAKFEVITHSTCECVYFVEADSFAEANQIALDGTVDFVQTHVGEKLIAQSHLDDDTEWSDWLNSWRAKGYF